ncbi:hypothetical protein [uncultured Muribaculum sp.]|uniref:hypothetical protein n=2 Tax=uncultured Muribaculum sp. TaxID=1918613 RepID=UPI0025B00128|nr:hypothetical protein [uncultured Muribaculum sp.]
MNKTSVIIASVLATAALYSCNSDDNNTYESTFARNMIVAVSDPAGTTKYTATVASFTMDMYSPQESKMVIATIKKPDGKIINMGTCENLTLGASTTQMDYTFKPNTATTYLNFDEDMPATLSGTLSALAWNVSRTSNTSIKMTFSGGDRMSAFGADLGFFSNTSVIDTQNPDSEPFITNDVATNNVRIEMSADTEKKTANVYMYQANFDKEMKKKIDFMIEGVKYDINAESGVLTLRIDEAIPYLLTNNIKGDPMPSYKITDFECTIWEGFSMPGLFKFTCGGRYELTASLVEKISKPEDDKE